MHLTISTRNANLRMRVRQQNKNESRQGKKESIDV